MMLLLARKVGQSLVIAGNIRVTIDRIRGRGVRLRIDAPRQILVDREEVWRRRETEDHSRAGRSAAELQYDIQSQRLPR